MASCRSWASCRRRCCIELVERRSAAAVAAASGRADVTRGRRCAGRARRLRGRDDDDDGGRARYICVSDKRRRRRRLARGRVARAAPSAEQRRRRRLEVVDVRIQHSCAPRDVTEEHHVNRIAAGAPLRPAATVRAAASARRHPRRRRRPPPAARRLPAAGEILGTITSRATASGLRPSVAARTRGWACAGSRAALRGRRSRLAAARLPPQGCVPPPRTRLRAGGPKSPTAG